jgi:hypothetical protein
MHQRHNVFAWITNNQPAGHVQNTRSDQIRPQTRSSHLLAHTSLCDILPEASSRQQDLVQIDACQAGVLLDDVLVHFQHVSPPNHVIHGTEAHGCHVLTHVLCHHEEEVDGVLRLTSKLGSQYRVLQTTDCAPCMTAASGSSLRMQLRDFRSPV